MDHHQQLRDQFHRFVAFSDEEWNMLAPNLEEHILHRGDFFAREGKRANTVAFVIEGDLRQFYTLHGEEKTTYFFFENHLMSSYISCITGQPSLLSIQALTDCVLITFRYGVLRDLYVRSHAWERCGRLIAEYIAIGLEERMVGLLTLSPEERYRQLLESNKKKIIERIPQQYIANYLGITAVSLSRIRKRIAGQ